MVMATATRMETATGMVRTAPLAPPTRNSLSRWLATSFPVLGTLWHLYQRPRRKPGLLLLRSYMPIYEYVCDDCGERFERIVMSQRQKITCPKCESAKHTIQLSVFAAPANGSKSSM